MPADAATGPVMLGGGDFVYEVIEDWGRLPDGCGPRGLRELVRQGATPSA